MARAALFWRARGLIKLTRLGCETELCGGMTWLAYRSQDSGRIGGRDRLRTARAPALRLDCDIAQRQDPYHLALRIADGKPAQLAITHELLRDLEIIFGGALSDRTRHRALHSYPMK